MQTEKEKQHNPGLLSKGNPSNQALIAIILNHPLAQIMGQRVGYGNIDDFILNQIEEGKAEELNRLFFPWELEKQQNLFKKACDESDLETVASLIDDPDLNPAAQKNYAVGKASEKGNLPLLKILLMTNRVNPADDEDYALRCASKQGHVQVVKELLSDNRVNPAIRNNRPLQLAAEKKNVFVILLLMCDKRIYQQGLELLLNSMETPEQKEVVKHLYEHYDKCLLFKRNDSPLISKDIVKPINAFLIGLG